MGKADGYLKIKTRLDNSDVDKDVKDLENKIKKVHTDNVNASNEQRDLQAEIDKYNQLTQKADKYRQQLKMLQKEKKDMFAMNPSLAVSTTPEYSNLNSQIDTMRQKYAEVTKEIDKQSPKIDKVHQKLNKIKVKQEENNAKISEFQAKIERIKMNKVEQGINSVGKSISGTIGKIGRMTLAVLGIRTAINAVRSAISLVAQYNPQIATDISYIKYALAQTVLPVVQKLVSLAYTLLGYINAITSAWFGFNLFANSSAKKFKGIASSAKSINNSLAGFDEINVLSDKSDSSGGGGAGTPSMDLSSMQGEIPGWLQWIIDNKELVLGIISGITAGLIAMKLLGLDPLLSLGIGLIVAGVVEAVQGLINFIKDPSWENFITILEGIAIALTGVAVVIGVLTGNWIPLVIASIALIATEVVKHWDEINEALGGVPDNILQWIIDNKELVLSALAGIVSGLTLIKLGLSGIKALGIGALIAGIILLIQSVINYLNDPTWEDFGNIITAIGLILLGLGIIIGGIPLIIAGVIAVIVGLVVTNWENIKGVLQGAIDWMYSKMDLVKEKFGIVGQAIWQSMIDLVEVAIDTFEGLFSGIKTILDGIITVSRGIFNGDMKTVLEGFKQIFKGIFDSLWSIAKAPLNLIIKGINHLIDGANKIKFDVPDWVPGLGGKTFGFNIMKLPELAKGGVVDGPTPLIAGEAGREAILPLKNNTEWVDMFIDRMEERLGTRSNNDSVKELVLKFEGELAQLARIFKPYLDEESQRKGYKLVTGGAS